MFLALTLYCSAPEYPFPNNLFLIKVKKVLRIFLKFMTTTIISMSRGSLRVLHVRYETTATSYPFP